jgi:VWFA-related protein
MSIPAGWGFLAAGTLLVQQPPITLTERVDVSRVLIDARVVGDRGEAIGGLTPDDFRVRIGGRPARVESVQWVARALAAASDPTPSPAETSLVPQPAAEGRLVVFLVQKSLERGRIGGLMRTLVESRPFLDNFTRHDRLAVLSFDSHLTVWLDFTGDIDRVREVLQSDLLTRGAPQIEASAPPSLVAGLSPARARRFSTVEESLYGIANALAPLPGAKVVVLMGHGFGRASFSRDLAVATVAMDGYEKTRRALQDARATIFCLDITEADYHTLEVGLQQVSADTGGYYERMFHFPALAFERLAATLAGHYVLFVERPELRRGSHGIDIDLIRRKGTVLARRTFEVEEHGDSRR